MFLLGAFVAGSAIGYAADRTFTKTERYRPSFNQRQLRDQLQAKLKLTPSQRALVDSAYDWRSARRRELEAPIRPALDSVNERIRPALDSVNERIRPVIDSINERVRPALDSVYGQIKPSVDSLIAVTHTRVLAVLDSSQKKIYLQMIEDSKMKSAQARRMSGDKR